MNQAPVEETPTEPEQRLVTETVPGEPGRTGEGMVPTPPSEPSAEPMSPVSEA
jgi:hypothetical protein